MDLFFSTLLLKKNSEYIMYHPSIRAKSCLDSVKAELWYFDARESVIECPIELHFFGKTQKKTIFVFKDNEGVEDVTEVFTEKLYHLVKDEIIQDEQYQLLKNILCHVGVGMKGDMVAFYKLDIKKEFFTTTASPIEGLNVHDVKTFFTNETEWKYHNALLTIAEAKLGYVNFSNYSVLIDTPSGKQVHQYKINSNLTFVFNTKTQELLSAIVEDCLYELRKHDGVWTLFDGEKIIWNTMEGKPFEAVYEEEEGDIKTVKIYGAYTHNLRKMMNFTPQKWQYNVLFNQKRKTFVAGCRRAGKTNLSAYRVMRAVYRSPFSNLHNMRPMKVTYLAPTKEKFKSFQDFLNTLTQNIRVMKGIKENVALQRYTLLNEGLDINGKRMSTVVAVCDLVSAESDEPGRSSASDEIVIDEAGFVPREVWLNLLPILENERATLYAISTIDYKTPKQWFYEYLLAAEYNVDKEAVAVRVDIDQIDDAVLPQTGKDTIKAALAGDPTRYYAELYATFPNLRDVFTADWINTTSFTEKPIGVIVSYDPAKHTDYGAIIESHVHQTKHGMYLEMVAEHELQGEYTTVQRPYLKRIVDKYRDMKLPLMVIIDATVVGDVVAEVMRDLVTHRVWYTNSEGKIHVDKHGRWVVPKPELVRILQVLIEMEKVGMHMSLRGLQEQLRNFTAINTNSGRTQYQAKTGHDDLVNAAMLGGFGFGYLMHGISDYAEEVAKEEYLSRIGENGLLTPTIGARVEPTYSSQPRRYFSSV